MKIIAVMLESNAITKILDLLSLPAWALAKSTII